MSNEVEAPVEAEVPPPRAVTRTPASVVGGLIRTARPRQWVKNILVLAAPFVSSQITNGVVLKDAAVAFVAFCLAASAVYFVNDAVDVEADRAHPTKRNR